MPTADELEEKMNWSGGPTFDLHLVSETHIDGNALHQFLLDSGKFTLHSGAPSEKRMRTFFEVTPSVKLAMEHSFTRRTHSTNAFWYEMFIRPRVFQNFVGAQSDVYIRSIQDTTNLSILVNAFIGLTFSIKTSFDVEYVTIADECEGQASPQWHCEKGIHLSRPICDVLHIPFSVLGNGCLALVCCFL